MKDPIRLKRRITSVVSVAEEVTKQYSGIAKDIPGSFNLSQDWVTMNSYPASGYDYIEKYVHASLGAAIWILDYLKDNGKISALNEILGKAPPVADIPIPDVWDPCHSQALLKQLVGIIRNRNADCSGQEKAVRKNKNAIPRVYMDRPTAESKIDHPVPSRYLYDQIIALICPDALAAIEAQYKEMYWDWLHRYFFCRKCFAKEEQTILSGIEDFQRRKQMLQIPVTVQTDASQTLSILSNTRNVHDLLNSPLEQYRHVQALEYEHRALYKKQEEFNARFRAFTRDIGEFPLIPNAAIEKQYGPEIAAIWAGFQIREPYSMCMAFLSLLDQGSDLPWCYFPGIILHCCYTNILPWTRTRYIPECDDIWEHVDSETGTVVPGPTDRPLSKKIKEPDLDDWYRMEYHDNTKSGEDATDLFNLAHIFYEITGCIMPRKPERHLAALNTLRRYGINSKKANLNYLYCLSLLGEAKNQTHCHHFASSEVTDPETVANNVETLQEQLASLKEELSQCKQVLQNAQQEVRAEQHRNQRLMKQLSGQADTIQDLSEILFDREHPESASCQMPYRTASNIIVFSANDVWIRNMVPLLPDVLFCCSPDKVNSDILRKADTIWIQPIDMTYTDYQKIITNAKQSGTPVRIFPSPETSTCAALLSKTDIRTL